MVADHELLRDRMAAALEYYVRARDPKLPEGLWNRPESGEWQLRTKIADCRWGVGPHRRALAELEQVLPDVPEDNRPVVALAAVHRCLQVEQFAAAYRWTARAHEVLPQHLNAHLEVVDLAFSLPAKTARSGDFAALDRAVSSGSWQAAYDAAALLPLENLAALARIIRLSERLTDQGAPEAAVDLLSRAIDAHPGEPLVYWVLAHALNQQGCHADAANALEMFDVLQSAPAELAA